MPGGKPKKFDAKILISAIVISALLFTGGILTGYTINKGRLSSIEKDMREITKLVENFQLQFLFFDVLGENSTCPLLSATLSDINDESYEIGSKLTSYGSESEIQDYNEYMDLKKEYSRLLVGYWLLANKLKRSCRSDTKTIIYFFSKKCSRCDDQGFILTYLKRKYKENLLIFALDADLDEPSLQTLKIHYNVTIYPSLIIEGKLYEDFKGKEELENILFPRG